MNLAEARTIASLALANGERLTRYQCEFEYDAEGNVTTITITGAEGKLLHSLLVSDSYTFQDDEWIEEYDDYMTYTTHVEKVGPLTYFVSQHSDMNSARLLITLATPPSN